MRFNLSSPKQLGEVLFEKLKLDPKAKKTKSGQYATGEDVLMKLAHNNQIVDDILAYRQLTKLKSTYVDALPLMINPKTGTCAYQLCPGRCCNRKAFQQQSQSAEYSDSNGKRQGDQEGLYTKGSGHMLFSADYSQIELRIVAAISGDPAMCEAFQQKKDIHNATAAKVYGIEESAVTKEQRYKAKSVNFGIIYGQGAFGLADNLGISRTEAKEIIDNYKRQFQEFRSTWMKPSISRVNMVM